MKNCNISNYNNSLFEKLNFSLATGNSTFEYESLIERLHEIDNDLAVPYLEKRSQMLSKNGNFEESEIDIEGKKSISQDLIYRIEELRNVITDI